MDIKATTYGDQAHFKVKGNIDERGAENLKHRFHEINASGSKEVVFDFGEVSFIGSAGIGKLLLFYKDIALNGGTMRIENLSDSVYEMFNVLKLNTIFSVSKGSGASK